MSVRFIIGRAGTGKSTGCAAEIRAEAARDPLGGALLWLTPEQGTFTAERMLLTRTGGKEAFGSFRAQVLSFRRLAALIGRDVGFLESHRIKPLDDLARVVLLEETVRAHRGELQIFGAVADRPGFVQKLDATLRELRQHGHSGDSLRELAERADGAGDAVTTRKLRDLALLLEAWSTILDASNTWDFEKIMHHAALRAGEAKLLTGNGGAQVWVDGFSALSALEMRMLVALGEHCRSVTVTLLADPHATPIRDLRCAPEEMGLFARTERLYCRLMDTFRQYGVRVDGTTALGSPRRFENEALQKVERELFVDLGRRPVAPKSVAGGGMGGEMGGGKRHKPVQASLFAEPDLPQLPGVEIWECSDPETEVRVVAQRIRDLVIRAQPLTGETPLRYRDIGVIVPELSGYQDAIRRAFSEHQIPHFIDERRSIAHHPLVELLRSAVAIAATRWDQDELLLYLKTGLAGIPAEEVALVENYLIEHGITHVPWSVPWRWAAPNQKEEDEEGEERFIPEHERELLARVNDIRTRVYRDLRPTIDALESLNKAEAEAATDARAYITALSELLTRLNVETQIAAWSAAALKGGNAELAQIHEQVWRQLQELLATLGDLLTGRKRALEEFARILATALETLTLALIPPTVDQVLVSSVTRSRVPELKVAFILGAVEGQFPKVVDEDAILSDAQREFFNAHARDPIADGSGRQLLEMQFFDYTAMTRASRQLIVCYPLADRRGRAVGKSRYIGRLRELLSPEELLERKLDAASRTSLERIGTPDDLLAAVAHWARDLIRRHRSRESGEGNAPAMTALYDWLIEAPALAESRARVWPAIADRPEPRLDSAIAARFYPPQRDLRMSVSQLEKFAACPLQYFMHYTLGLRPRAVMELDTLNLGVLYHRILEKVYLRIIDGELQWPMCDALTLRRALEAEVDAATRELHAELAERTPAYEKMKSRTKKVLGVVLEGQRRRACAGDMRPVGVEVTFGDRSPAPVKAPEQRRLVRLPVLRIPTPQGHAVELNGKIDRVDAAAGDSLTNARHVAVIDYKSSSRKTLDLYLVYYGLALQLPVYAVVMETLAKRDPIAALYVPLGLTRRTIKRASEADAPESDKFYQSQLAVRGVVDAGGAHYLDNAIAPHEDRGAASQWYRIGYTRDGELPKWSDMLPHEEFDLLLQFVRWKIASMVDDLMAGRIAPAPYRDSRKIPCEDCDFSMLCPFDRVSGNFREVPKISREEALSRMRADMEQPAPNSR